MVTFRTFVGSRHLVDGLNVASEVRLLAKGLATGLAFEVLDLPMDGRHVTLHMPDLGKFFLADDTFSADSCRFLLVTFGETMTCLMILENLAV